MSTTHPRRLVRLAVGACLAAVLPAALAAQQPGARPGARAAAGPDTTERVPPSDTMPLRIVTHHAVTIDGQRVEYDATLGSIILRDSADRPIGNLHYTAYTRTGVGAGARRPITFAYNGGPGSSSIWVHMGAFGPRRVPIPDTVHAPPPPYRLVDNQYSILDVTDLVFVDPIGTGLSRPVGIGKGKDFWGVDEDASSLSQFITRWLSDNGRWNSPRYLLGESYGTTRSAAIANYLQNRYSTDLNGVMLVSAVLDFQTITFDAGNVMPYILYLPAYTAVASYHHALPTQPANLRSYLSEVERFATTDYAQALLQGWKLDPVTRARVVAKLHEYTGLDTTYLSRANLRVSAGEFEAELLRERGVVVGRLDARFTGPSDEPLAQGATYDPQSTSISSAYVSEFNTYLRDELGYKGDRPYAVSGRVQPWNWNHPAARGWPGHTNVSIDLAEAMRHDPNLQVLLNSGVYDLATPYFAAEWAMQQMDIPASLRSHVHMAEYEAGHMVYVYEPSLAELRKNIVSFIAGTTGKTTAALAGEPTPTGGRP